MIKCRTTEVLKSKFKIYFFIFENKILKFEKFFILFIWKIIKFPKFNNRENFLKIIICKNYQIL